MSLSQFGTALKLPAIKGHIELSKVTFYFAHSSGHGSDDLYSFMLRSCTLEAAAGQHVAIVGPSGSGKTTLLRVVAGIYTPRAGSVKFDRHESSTVDQVRVLLHLSHLHCLA